MNIWEWIRCNAARNHVKNAKEHVESCSLLGHALYCLWAAKALLDLEGCRQGDERQEEPLGVPQRQHDKTDVRGEQQERVEDVRDGVAQGNGQCVDAGLLVALQISRVVAVQNGFGVEGERYSIVYYVPLDVAGLRHKGKQNGYWSENYEDEDVTEGNVLEANASGVEERRGQAAKVDESQVLHFGW